jgi:peroxiredoxin
MFILEEELAFKSAFSRIMPRIHLYTALGCIFVATGIAILPSSVPMIAAPYFLAAYLLSMKEVSKYTSVFQFVTVFAAACSLGSELDFPFSAFPFFLLAMFLASLGSLGRMIFFRFFSYTRYTWFEPALLFSALVSFVAGNLFGNHSWTSWIFPLPVLILQSILAFGILKDKTQLLDFTRGGYKIAVGSPAPDFELPDQNGQLITLSSFKGKRHILLVFVRGDWCPGCHMMLRTYQREAARFRGKNIFAMAIGPDPVGVNREMVEKLGLDFHVLSDEKQRTAMTYGVQLDTYENDFAEKYEEGIPLPASFLIDNNGVVRYVSRPDKVGEFLDPRTIFPIIDKL